MKNKKAAFEMSITTIVILVIAMTMLILGMILVRNLMCKSISLTGDISDKVRGQIDDLFQQQGGEVQCIGGGTQTVDLIPGRVNIIWCGIKAPVSAQYRITIKSSSVPLSTLGVTGEQGGTWTVSPGDNDPKKILRLNVPKNMPEGLVTINLGISKGSTALSDQTLDLQVRQLDWFRGNVC